MPIYWLLLSKKAEATPRAVNAQGNAPQAGSSNFYEQVATIRPILKLLKDYKLVIIGDREYRSTAFDLWLNKKKIDFVLRLNKNTKIRPLYKKYDNQEPIPLISKT